MKKRIQILLWTVALAAIAAASVSTALACTFPDCMRASSSPNNPPLALPGHRHLAGWPTESLPQQLMSPAAQ